MTTPSPQETIRYWGTFASTSVLPGVGATNPFLRVGDFAFISPSNVLYRCTSVAGVPAIWTPVQATSLTPTACTHAAATALDDTMSTLDCDDSGGVVTINLPDVTAPSYDRVWYIFKIPAFGTGGINLVPHGTDKINNVNATTAAPGSTAAVQGMWILRRISATPSWLLVG